MPEWLTGEHGLLGALFSACLALAGVIRVLWSALREARDREVALLREGTDRDRAYMARLQENGSLMGGLQQGQAGLRDYVKIGFKVVDERLKAIEREVKRWAG